MPLVAAKKEFLTNYILENPVTQAQAFGSQIADTKNFKKNLLNVCEKYSQTHSKETSGFTQILGVKDSGDGKLANALGHHRRLKSRGVAISATGGGRSET